MKAARCGHASVIPMVRLASNTSGGTARRRAGSLLAVPGLVLLTLAAGCAPVQSRPWHPRAVGTLLPSNRDRDAGEVAAAPRFDLARYRTIAIGNVSVDAPASWSEEDRQIASSVLAHLRSDLAQKLGTAGRSQQVIDRAGTTPAPVAALRLDVRVTQLELDRLAPTDFSNWVGPGSVQMETRFVDVESGRVVLVTADRRTARRQTTQARDIQGTTALLDEAADYLVSDLVNFLLRSRGMEVATAGSLD